MLIDLSGKMAENKKVRALTIETWEAQHVLINGQKYLIQMQERIASRWNQRREWKQLTPLNNNYYWGGDEVEVIGI